MEYWDLLSEYLDDLLPLPTPIKREELVPFDYYGIPEELRGSVIEKVTPVSFARLSRANKILLEECSSLRRKPFLTVPSIRVEKKGMKVILREPGYEWARPVKTRRWLNITGCGFRFALKKIIIKTIRTDRLGEMLTLFEKGVISVERIVFPTDFEGIPFDLMAKLIEISRVTVLQFVGNFSRLHLTDFEQFPQVRTLISDLGRGVNNKEFLKVQKNIDIGYHNTISVETVVSKVKIWKRSPVDGRQFIITMRWNQQELPAALQEIGVVFTEKIDGEKTISCCEMGCDDGKHVLEIRNSQHSNSYYILEVDVVVGHLLEGHQDALHLVHHLDNLAEPPVSPPAQCMASVGRRGRLTRLLLQHLPQGKP